jgi:hypothetical protein
MVELSDARRLKAQLCAQGLGGSAGRVIVSGLDLSANAAAAQCSSEADNDDGSHGFPSSG